MNSLVFLVPIALILGAAALGAFFWSMSSDQYEDLDGAGERIIFQDDRPGSPHSAAGLRRRLSFRTDRTVADGDPGGEMPLARSRDLRVSRRRSGSLD
ncbi:cbb3-type cytochrome oxidase assembly protein CcoS [Labrys sp. LIt4]|nr:cbb3-type cytochrome oxidase assembly protein CcoS [Labrys sp. LIt4]